MAAFFIDAVRVIPKEIRRPGHSSSLFHFPLIPPFDGPAFRHNICHPDNSQNRLEGLNWQIRRIKSQNRFRNPPYFFFLAGAFVTGGGGITCGN